MLSGKIKQKVPRLRLSAITWYKDSHSLYDYQSTKITETKHDFDLSVKGINFYRKKNSSQVLALDCRSPGSVQAQEFDFIGHFEVESLGAQRAKVNVLNVSTYKDKSKTTNTEKQKTNESVDSLGQKEEEPYFIVGRDRAVADGYKLVPGMILKLGRIEYYISQLFDGAKRSKKALENSKALFNENIFQFNYDPNQKRDACKICLEEHNKEADFLFNPCKCNGSCGSVHFQCLTEWIRIKVKKEVVGGTLHYNFTKFQCEVCRSQFPGYVEVSTPEGAKYIKQMIGVDKPTGNYLVLQSACQKEKSIMVIQNTPEEGIKIGRGHECQIRITDISVSRKHAVIKNVKNQFYIFDNKSKFGTLVKEENMSFEVRKEERKAIQIGRSILEFEILK